MDEKKISLTLLFMLCLFTVAVHARFVFAYIGFIVYVSPEHNSARVNHIFSVNISIADVPESGLWAYEFRLYYNNSLLEPLSAEIPAGHFLEPTLSPDNILILDSGIINQTEGTVSFAVVLINPEPGKTGSGTLANITFVAIAPGECALRIGGYVTDEPKFVDGNGDPIPPYEYSITDGYFEAIPPPPPPIPPPTPKAGWETAAFDFMGIYGYLTFPEECHPNDTLTHELIIAAEPDGIHVIHFGINISCNTASGETILYAEKIIENEELPEDWVLNKNVTLTIPTDAYGKLCCVIEADTYKRFTTCDSAVRFHTTRIRTLTYEGLLAAYNSLLNLYNDTLEELDYWSSEYQTLNNTYHQLLTDYQELLNQHNITVVELNHWLTEYQTLNNTYHQLLTDYDLLNFSYQKLETDYESLQASFKSLEASFNSLNSSYNLLKRDYDSLQAEHNDLLDASDLLNSTYMGLLSNHTGLLSDFESLQNKLSSLETSYDNLLDNYNLLNSTYHTLLDEYERLKSTTDALEDEIQNVKALWGILLAMAMVATALTIYLVMKILGERKRKT